MTRASGPQRSCPSPHGDPPRGARISERVAAATHCISGAVPRARCWQHTQRRRTAGRCGHRAPHASVGDPQVEGHGVGARWQRRMRGSRTVVACHHRAAGLRRRACPAAHRRDRRAALACAGPVRPSPPVRAIPCRGCMPSAEHGGTRSARDQQHVVALPERLSRDTTHGRRCLGTAQTPVMGRPHGRDA
jgi:hypothetical protein